MHDLEDMARKAWTLSPLGLFPLHSNTHLLHQLSLAKAGRALASAATRSKTA